MSFTNVPDLERRVDRGRQKVVARRVELNASDLPSVKWIVLQQRMGAGVPDVDVVVASAGSNASAIGVESHCVHGFAVVVECLQASARFDVPQPNSFVVRTCSCQPVVW